MAIVTGGARGIGRNVCHVLAEGGARVVVNYAHSEDRARVVVEEIEAKGGVATAFRADVRDLAAYEAMVAHAKEAHGRLDGIVNNAIAGKQDGAFDEATDADFANAFDYGCRAIANSVRASRPGFKAQGGGRIVNVVTEIWDQSPPGWTVYVAGKGAMVGMSRSLAAELGPEGITVNMVAPGWMMTDKPEEGDGPATYAKTVPLGQRGSGEEIGKACAFFVSDLASFVTGAYLPVTGGRVTQMG